MSSLPQVNAQAVLFAIYVLCAVALNAVAMLISLFYRKKFRHPAPRFGFLAVIVLFLVYCVLLLSGTGGSVLTFIVKQLSLAVGALVSIVCTVNLFLVMQKVRK